MATRIAEMVAYACVPEFKFLPANSKLVRDEILKTPQFVNLEGLLEFCWNHRIPVVYFDGFPKTQQEHKFDGMVAFFEQRPVIVISLNRCSPAKLLFILAHELGHIIKLKVMHLHQRGLFMSVLGLRSLAETKLCCTWNGGDDFSPLCGKVRVSVQGCGSTAHQLIFTAHHPTSQAGQWRKYLYFLFLNSISNYASSTLRLQLAQRFTFLYEEAMPFVESALRHRTSHAPLLIHL